MRNMKAARRILCGQKLREEFIQITQRNLCVSFYSEIFEIVFYDITHLKCVRKKLTEM